MNVEKFWDNLAEKYSKSPVRNEEVYQYKLNKTNEFLKPDSLALEWGCGTGTTAIHHAPSVQHMTATDISNNMLDIARKRAAEAEVSNITFTHSTVEAFEADPESFDAILALNVVHLLDDPNACINKAFYLLKPGGVFVTSIPCLGDTLFSYWRILIPIFQLIGKAPSVQYMKRKNVEEDLAATGFEIAFAREPIKGEAAFIIARKPH